MATEITFDAHVAEGRTPPLTRYLPVVGRVSMGLIFFVCGLNGFFNFLPQPSTPPPEGAVALGIALMKAGYLFPLIKGTEAVAGAMLLSNRWVPLALAVIAPVVVNIVAFHAFLAPSGVGLAVLLLLLEIYLAWVYRRAYRPMLVTRAAGRSEPGFNCKETTMRFMMIIIPKGYEKAVPGTVPEAKAVAAMMKYNEALQKAGVLLALDGLHPLSMGARISFPGGKAKVTDGPFAEVKEVVGGYWMIQVKSKAEAIEWASQCPASENEVIEIRQVQEFSDFPNDVKEAIGHPSALGVQRDPRKGS